jgi:hypothetical protein
LGISISHGVPSTRSATQIGNLGQHLAHTLSGSEWREIAHLFDGRLSAPVYTPPTQASRIGALLHKPAGHPAMDPGWGDLASLLGDAAQHAARAGQNWEWT